MPKPITFPIELDLDRVKVVYPQADGSLVVAYDNGSDYDLGGKAAQRFLVAWAAAIAPETTTEPTSPASGAYTWPSKPVRNDAAIAEKLEQILLTLADGVNETCDDSGRADPELETALSNASDLFALLGLEHSHPWRPVESADHGDTEPY